MADYISVYVDHAMGKHYSLPIDHTSRNGSSNVDINDPMDKLRTALDVLPFSGV